MKSATYLAHFADRIFGRPLMITTDKAELILAVLGNRIGADIDMPEPDMSRFAGAESTKGPYRITKDGIAIVPVIGTLVNRGAYIGAHSGMTSYEGLTKQLQEARKDSDVRGILLDMASPGGEAGGAFEIPELLREIRKTKPVIAMVNDMAASAAYAIASAANQIYVTRTGLVGSIGVIMVHFDRSAQLAEDGIKPTIIHAGARKADGNSFGPLPALVRERMQKEIDALRDTFIAAVIEGRPQLKAADVKATEAECYMGQAAVDIGLADGVSTFENVLKVMSNKLSGQLTPPSGYERKATKETPMSEATDTPSPAAGSAPAESQATLDKARADGMTKGAAAERERIRAIVTADEAKGRMAMAVEIACGTNLDVAAAKSLLSKSTVEQASAGAGQTAALYEAVARTGGKPNVRHAGIEDNQGRPSLSDGMSKRFKKGA